MLGFYVLVPAGEIASLKLILSVYCHVRVKRTARINFAVEHRTTGEFVSGLKPFDIKFNYQHQEARG